MAEKSLIMIQQENLELRKENEAFKTTVTTLLNEVERLRSIERLPVDPNVVRIVLTSEQKIIEDQIDILRQQSATRALSLEEVRALDLLIKNKRLLDPDKPIEPDYTKVPEGQTESDLLRIAGNIIDVKVATPSQRESKSRAKAGKKDPVV